MSELKIGSVVRVKSGGVKMTVGYISENHAKCYWVDHEQKYNCAEWPISTLAVVGNCDEDAS